MSCLFKVRLHHQEWQPFRCGRVGDWSDLVLLPGLDRRNAPTRVGLTVSSNHTRLTTRFPYQSFSSFVTPSSTGTGYFALKHALQKPCFDPLEDFTADMRPSTER